MNKVKNKLSPSKEKFTIEMLRYTEYFGFFGPEEVAREIELVAFVNALAEKLKKAAWLQPAYVKKAREEAAGNLSQEGLAKLVPGITRQVIANYEAGLTVPQSNNIFQVYKVLGALGSESALVALLEIRELDRESLITGAVRAAKDIELINFRQQKRTADLAECESDMQRLKEKLKAKHGRGK